MAENVETRFIQRYEMVGEKAVLITLDRLESSTRQITTASNQLNKELADISRSRHINRVAQDAAVVAVKMRSAEEGAGFLARRLKEIGATSSEIKTAANEFARMGSEIQRANDAVRSAETGGRGTARGVPNLGRVGASLSGLGLGEIGNIASAVDDVQDIVQEIGAISSVAPAAGVGLGAMAAPMVAIAGVAAIVGAGLALVNNELERSREATRLYLEGLDLERQLKAQNRELALTRTGEENRQIATNQFAGIQDIEAEIARIKEVRDQTVNELAAIASQGPLNIVANALEVRKLKDEIDSYNTKLSELAAEFNKTGTEFQNTVTTLGPMIDKREAEDRQIEQTTKRIVEYNTALKEQQVKAEQAAKERETINNRLADVEATRARQIEERVIADRRAAETGLLEQQIANAREREEAQIQQQKIAQIRTEGAEAERQALDRAMQNELKIIADYREAEKRATQDYSLDRVRKLDDLHSDLTDLAARSDVAAFVVRRTSGLRDISRGDQNFGIAASRRLEDAQQSIRENAAAYRQEAQQRQQQLQARLNQEVQAGNQQLSLSQRLQQQLANLRNEYARQDLVTRRAYEDAAYQQTVVGLRSRAAELTNFLNTVGQSIGNLYRAISGNTSASGTRQPVYGYGTPRASYATGTPYVPSTGIYMLHQGEAIVPASQNRGRNGMTLVIQQANFGAVASPADVQAGVRFVLDAVAGALVLPGGR